MSVIAFDAGSEHPTPTGTLSDPTEWTHTPAGTPRGIVVLLAHTTSSSDIVLAVTYGGVAMTRVRTDADVVGEVGRTYIYFLGSALPVGVQTISVDRTEATSPMWGAGATLTASADLEVIDHDGLAADQADPQVTLQFGGRGAISFSVVCSGHNAPSALTDLASHSRIHDIDFGTLAGVASRLTTAQTTDDTIGYTATSEDVALSAVAIAEIVGAGATAKRRRPIVKSQAVHRASRW
jgi:hypothetical protein